MADHIALRSAIKFRYDANTVFEQLRNAMDRDHKIASFHKQVVKRVYNMAVGTYSRKC